MIDAIDAVLAERSDDHGRALLTQRRALALELAGDPTDPLDSVHCRHLGIDTPSALRSARWRSRRYFDRHPEASGLVDRVAELVAPWPGDTTSTS